MGEFNKTILVKGITFYYIERRPFSLLSYVKLVVLLRIV